MLQGLANMLAEAMALASVQSGHVDNHSAQINQVFNQVRDCTCRLNYQEANLRPALEVSGAQAARPRMATMATRCPSRARPTTCGLGAKSGANIG